MIDADTAATIRRTHTELRRRLLAERGADGFWQGHLSSSALSTATATSALAVADRRRHAARIDRATAWLADNQNADGGWGDTTESPSHPATTLLARAALRLSGHESRFADALAHAEQWTREHVGETAAERDAVFARLYGEDRTFAVPILMNLALAGEVDWADIPPLPFELARIPHRWLRLARAHVVSYALPALIAIGLLLHRRRPRANRLLHWLRDSSTNAALRRLRAIQPASGGFIEAVPLTSFVAMSLAAADAPAPEVLRDAVGFLEHTQRSDGSWPIDSNLAMWVTTLSVGALAAGPGHAAADLPTTLNWIADHRHVAPHPFTQAAPGGWAWTHLPGGVPDADDTASALLALALDRPAHAAAAGDGIRWLLDLQNSDGGWPTFCRGWGRLPFDRSGPDLTAHAIRALAAWRGALPQRARRIDGAIRRALAYLACTQCTDGSWHPLWFGNQHAPGEANPVFGTARVLAAYRDLELADAPPAERGVDFLLSAQQGDGGWGGDAGVFPSVEETAVAVDALSGWLDRPAAERACAAGCRWLVRHVAAGTIDTVAPIGLYFTKLWYAERLYPLIWSTGAMGRMARRLDARAAESPGTALVGLER